MLFGIPWFGIVAIVAIVGGLFLAYKEKEMELDEKRLGKSRELNEMRQIIHNLKSRVESLEAERSQTRSSGADSAKSKERNPLGDIEIEDEIENQNDDNGYSKSKSRT